MAAGIEYREESDCGRAGRPVPARPDLRHRVRLGRRCTRHLLRVPRVRGAAVQGPRSVGGRALRRLQRLRQHHESEGGVCAGRRSSHSRSAPPGARASALRRSHRSALARRRSRASSATRLAAPTTRCTARRPTTRSSSPAIPNLTAEESESFNVGVSWESRASRRASTTGISPRTTRSTKRSASPTRTSATTRRAPSVSAVRRWRVTTWDPLQQINATFDNINQQSADGIDLEASYRFDVGGGTLAFGLIYSRLLDFERVELGPDGDFVTRVLTGEYEYPEDRATLTADWDSDKWGRVRRGELHRLVPGSARFQLRHRSRLRQTTRATSVRSRRSICRAVSASRTTSRSS